MPDYPSYPADQIMDEEEIYFDIQQRAVKLALRRNILKRCVSEDLLWAEIINADNPTTLIGYEAEF